MVIVHLFFIVFALLGGLLALWRRWLALLHLPTAIWASLIEFTGWICPLTPLELMLRQAGGEAGYPESFIARYLMPILYPDGLTRGIQIILGIVALSINVGIYSLVLYHMHKSGHAAKPLKKQDQDGHPE